MSEAEMMDIFGEPISSYTQRDAVADGILFHLGGLLYINVETAVRLAPPNPLQDESAFDVPRLGAMLTPIMRKFVQGIFFDDGATEWPEECSPEMALYFIEEANGKKSVIWLEHGTFFFPEYRQQELHNT